MDFDEDRQELSKNVEGLNRGHLTVCNYWAIKIGGDEVEDVMVVGQEILLSNFCIYIFRKFPIYFLYIKRTSQEL